MMKWQMLILVLTGLLTSSFNNPSAIELERCDQNFVEIYGKTNVNTFELELKMDQPVNLLHNTQQSFSSSEKIHKIKFPVKSFECDNRAMYRDFIKVMKADEYPEITIALPHQQITNIEHKENTELKLDMEITIAGITRHYTIPARINLCQDNYGRQRILHGTKELALNDFNITPPTKFMGMVQVEKNITINFGFTL